MVIESIQDSGTQEAETKESGSHVVNKKRTWKRVKKGGMEHLIQEKDISNSDPFTNTYLSLCAEGEIERGDWRMV